MRLRISIRGRVRPSVGPSVRRSVGPSVRLSRVIFERRKTSFPMFRWRRNLTWTKRLSRTIQKLHQNVGPSVCPSMEDENERKWTINDDKVVLSFEPRGSCCNTVSKFQITVFSVTSFSLLKDATVAKNADADASVGIAKTRTPEFKRCDNLLVTYCSFPLVFVFHGWTDRRTDILMSFLNCPWQTLGPCQISSSSEYQQGRFWLFENTRGQTDRRTDGRTRPVIEMRSRI